MPDKADGFSVHRWYRLSSKSEAGTIRPIYQVQFEPSEGDDDDEMEEQTRDFETLDEAIAFGRKLLDL